MKILGLTGPSGAGKGAVCAAFAAHGIPSVDTDAVYHELLLPPSALLTVLCKEFSTEILQADGTLNRSALAARVFIGGEAGAQRQAILNRLTHGAIIDRTFELLRQYEHNGAAVAIIDAPLLIEAGLAERCDLVIAVLADRELRLRRLLTRDNMSKEQLYARLDAQPADDFYISHADVVIHNEGDLAALEKKVAAILARPEVQA